MELLLCEIKQQQFHLMVKKTQLRKYTVEKIMELVDVETNGENLKMYNEALIDKNKIIIQKRNALLNQLNDLRTRLEKIFREMNDGVKDRIQLKQKYVMDKYSRPSKDDIKQITQLFAYIENQHHLMQRNSHDLEVETKKLQIKIEELKPASVKRVDPTDLDEQYIQLNEQCAREQQVRDALIKEREEKLRHYSSIAGSIDQCRVEYELVEERIREKERELIQLTTYFEARQREDQQFLSDLRDRNMQLQSNLLLAQQNLNSNSDRHEQLMVKEIEALNKHASQ